MSLVVLHAKLPAPYIHAPELLGALPSHAQLRLLLAGTSDSGACEHGQATNLERIGGPWEEYKRYLLISLPLRGGT